MGQNISRHYLFCQCMISVVLLSFLMGCSTKNQETRKVNEDIMKTRFEGISVKNLKGEDVLLNSLWSDRRIVLVFLRHFG